MSDEATHPYTPVELTPETFTNRELSLIEFQKRVLAMAEDPDVPVLERVKFAAIVGSNLDEFFMVRVGSYIEKRKLGITKTRPDGYTPAALLTEIRVRASALIGRHREAIHAVLHDLENAGIMLRKVGDLKLSLREAVRAYFYEEVFPVLTPLAADHARPFPFISNLSLNLGVYLGREASVGRDSAAREAAPDSDMEFVRIKVPEALPRLVNLEQVVDRYAGQDADSQNIYLWIEDVIADNLDLLFPGMRVIEHHPFRVTRNADIDYDHEKEEELLDISAVIEAGVRERRFGHVVRLSVPRSISQTMLKRLIHELELDGEHDVYSVDGALGSADLMELAGINRPDLKYAPYVPGPLDPAVLGTGGASLFSAIRDHDSLLHHPYDSFAPVEDFFRAAAHDPRVLAIKATLYRVGKNSPVVQALMEARDNDKQVAVLVELKARFDEENNLEWARQLEHKGVHVTYGVEQLPVKTHAKVAMVVRKEGDGLRRYVHLGTGNYNASTARLYTDLGLFTANREIAEDASRLFNRLTGYAPATTYRRLLVAPEYLLPGLLTLVDNEIEAAREGKPARLVFKMNQLEEDVMIQKLYEASQAGVQVDLIIRGLCCLRPGIPGVSENIRVRSILGRYLEHPRIFYFQNAAPEQRIYAGSADLMRRNLYNRVEVVYPVLDPRLQRRILRLLATDLRSNASVWRGLPDGGYERIRPGPDEPVVDSQYVFMQDSSGLDVDL